MRVVYNKSVNSSDEIHDAYYISKLMMKVIEEIGPQNIVQVVTDNRANFKRAAHCVDLMMKDIDDILMVKSMVKKMQQITRFIYNHTLVHALMNFFTKGEILRSGATCFAANFIALRSLQQKKAALRTMFTRYYLNPAYQYKYEHGTVDSLLYPLRKVIQRMSASHREEAQALNESKWFQNATDNLRDSFAISIRDTMDPTPTLQKIAARILSQTTLSSGCERNWSTFALIHMKSCNRISYARLEKLNEDKDIPYVDPFDAEFVQGIVDPIIDWWIAMETDPPLLDEPSEPPRPSPIIYDVVEFESQLEDTDSEALERDMTLAPLGSDRVRHKRKRMKKTILRFIAVAVQKTEEMMMMMMELGEKTPSCHQHQHLSIYGRMRNTSTTPPKMRITVLDPEEQLGCTRREASVEEIWTLEIYDVDLSRVCPQDMYKYDRRHSSAF
ncbi:hypothetical protein Cni_G02411 [Canna indica]|uniref:DUF659 domain-containing protein n=1 Tax=Canna indica TaxID=4628 RepID=A0AAQ3JPR3_9LILI|nr:hypothetical protein Cni_G02411 [Canna indica]